MQFLVPVLVQSDNVPPVQGGTDASRKKFLDTLPILKDLKGEVISIMNDIHRDFGEHTLILSLDPIPLEKRLAVWSQCQILLSSTLRDGLSLPPLEFVTVKKI